MIEKLQLYTLAFRTFLYYLQANKKINVYVDYIIATLRTGTILAFTLIALKTNFGAYFVFSLLMIHPFITYFKESYELFNKIKVIQAEYRQYKKEKEKKKKK